MTDDAELLRRFADEESDAAFSELVARRIDFVYGVALRQVGGDTHLAQDVAQAVFAGLAGSARVLASRPTIMGWLYTSVRFAAAKALRARNRRLDHETKAHAMEEILSTPATNEVNWNELRPVLDAAMYELGERDREAILLRFFEGKSLADVGLAVGLAENSARMRVDRALEKLRERLAVRGVTSTAAALGLALAAQPVTAAPAGLAAQAATAALAGHVAAATGSSIIFMGTKLKTVALGALLVAGAGTWWATQQRLHSDLDEATTRNGAQARELAALRRDNQRLSAAQRQAEERLAAATAAGASVTTASPRSKLDNLRLIAALQQRKMIQPVLSVIEAEHRVAAPWAELFDLTPEERGRLDRALAAAAEQIGALELAHATASRRADGALEIEVEPFADEGGPVYDRLTRTLAEVLGSERYAAFTTLGLKGLEDQLRLLGAGRSTWTLTHDLTAANPAYAWRVDIRVDRLDGTTKMNSAAGPQLQGLVSFFMGPLVKLVPPDFGR